MVGIGWPAVQAALALRPTSRVADAGRRAAVALVLRDAAKGIEILFIRRAEDPRDPWSGQIAFPGGRAEPDDAHLQATAVRETREETHLDLASAGDYLGALDEVQAMARMQRMDLAIAPFVYRLTRSVDASAGHEVGSVHWVLLEDLLDQGAHSTTEYGPEGAALRFPCLRVDGLVIWGLTYRIFGDFTERLRSVHGAEGVE
jgi:8-oxo-dGTP pyrophosphatase MutT (NUDIX family)